MKVEIPKIPKKAKPESIKKALEILTPKEKRELILALTNKKPLEKKEHTIILSRRLLDKGCDVRDIPATL